MKRALAMASIAFVAACAEEPAEKPAPPPPAAPALEAPSIQTQPATTATATPAPARVEQPSGATTTPVPATLSMAQVEKTFGFHRRFFNAIYRARLAAKPKLAGTMLVSFTINPDGTTRDAKLEHSTLADPAFEQDILKQIGQTNFPPATGLTAVDKYPLEFSPK